MNFFVIKEVWFRYIFSNQKRGPSRNTNHLHRIGDTPGFLFILLRFRKIQLANTTIRKWLK
ncbi:hypothetical protein LEP1GSC103_1241 [Leptospira borgpetersenii serovar Javanica str. UI 09931]|uniref:Uncharacterized protein n=1 Tax=Leptospira borgpetersenii serovar Javanica str. UI 09931 TaxID=1049767 RepID=A0AAV3J6D1_LEPBO|nr:hypothetical protein C4Q31_13080 [Leptospira borgpetersenii serovar Ceylonica]EKQ90136.1 hypothetical protein LEP1GSC101_2131 [Leptospira borgpetersenii str. UI 09149]EMN57772.1 hypothetical protein LEP1GSC090_0566 [Leptospira borgpetersenii serovar Javanica str. MK146]EPG56288.1 hypothetical protein LEP1GSC103_1241 [Leptospira borgpetersenii serovar Javanica str. UI 09931]